MGFHWITFDPFNQNRKSGERKKERKSGAVWISQPVYIYQEGAHDEKFNMSEAKPIATPADRSVKLIKAENDSEAIDQGLYQSEVGCLLYLSTWMRLDIVFAVSHVAKFCSNQSKEHWTTVKRILHYFWWGLRTMLQIRITIRGICWIFRF